MKTVCKRCVMDNIGDDQIQFDENGICNYCSYALERKDKVYFPNESGEEKLKATLNKIKLDCKNDKYDCLMGLSGGLDSTYLAYLGAKYWGLRILAVHIDDGFNSPIAEKNIRNLCAKFNIDLIIEKPEEQEYYDLIKSFLRSDVPSIALPQDNVLQAYLNKYAKQYKIKYFLSGANFALESILQRGDGHIASDSVHIKDIHKKFGESNLNKLKLISIFNRFIGQKYISKINTIRLLDYIEYNREAAILELESEADFNYYGGKHYESIYTKFAQSYYLPKKFNIDKRKSHLSSLIVTNQLTREQALIELNKELYDSKEMDKDIELILSKINMSKDELKSIMERKPKKHTDYKTSKLIKYKNLARKYRSLLGE